MSASGPFDVHVVSHTHWDREWYLPFARFRQRLVELIDELLDEPRPDGPFLLDGQAVLLQDYLAVRPDREGDLREMLARGALEAGPWFVLADELIASGEALARNLLLGIRTVRARGGVPPRVLYCPDSFGHPADLPTLAAGFGFPLIILWRGLGGVAWPSGDAFRWRALDGASVLVHHLPPAGYEYGANLPTNEAQARARWRGLRNVLTSRARTNVLLVLNGADHHARQAGLEQALGVLALVAEPERVRASSLSAFASSFVDAAAKTAALPEIQGELRYSPGYTWTVPGTWSSRTYQKRRNARVERLLTREAEPWSAIAAARGGRDRAPLVRSAWRTLLECHPHDTLCGCSGDDVAKAADARFEAAEVEARGIVADSILDLVGHDPASARTASDRWQPQLILRNPSARSRAGVAEIDVIRFLDHEPVGPGSAGVMPHERSLEPLMLDGVLWEVIDRTVRSDRIESPRHYPDNDRVEVLRCLAWVELPGYGLVPLPLDNAFRGGEARFPSVPTAVVRATDESLDNGVIRLAIDDRGDVRVTDVATGREHGPLLRFEDIGDAGDLYTHSPIGEPISPARFLGSRSILDCPLRGSIRLRFALDVPASSSRHGRSQAVVTSNVDVILTVDAESPIVKIGVRGVNRARDHRLRIVFATGIRGGATLADAMFGPVMRETRAQPNGTEAMEVIPPTAPLGRWVCRLGDTHGMSVISDGLGEYEAMPDGAVAVTVLRCVGELSRIDLPERPGHAGWPTPTPRAQMLGPFRARFGVLTHSAVRDDAVLAVERAADDVLLPMTGTTLRSATDTLKRVVGVSLDGEGLRFLACKTSEDGEWTVLRCVNVSSRTVAGVWRCGWPVREARSSRLDERPGDGLAVRNGRVEVSVAPAEVVTVLVR
ncbi:MAG TPA: glycoside hydrolase family 38 C-terminal domain-containing protein [Gemmatimonadaceae bacterium]|nr:glycoside hydrolase family 38 C-terminal domain-containing protein [Gemmatimonadaceae bacterium]